MTLVWTLVVPRIVGPAGMGLLVLAWSTSSLLSILGGLASKTLLVKEIAAHPERAPRLLGAALWVRAACILPCFLLISLYVRLGHFRGTPVLVLYLAGLVTVATLFTEPLQAGFQAIERMEFLAGGEVINKAVTTVLGIALVLAGFRALALVVVLVVAAAAVLGLSALWIRPFFSLRWPIDPGAIRALVRSSLGYWAFAFFYTFYLWIDALILTLLTSPKVVGWYGVPTRLFTTLLFLPMIIGTAWLPRMAAGYATSPARLREIARTPLELTVIVMLPISVGAALIAGPLIRLLYGAAFDPAAPVLVILVLTLLPMALNMIAYNILVASGRQAIWTAALGVACVVNPALNVVLIRLTAARLQNGAIGAAWSLLLTELLIAVLAVVIVREFLDPRTLWRLTRAGLATAGMALAVFLAARFGLLAEVSTGVATFTGLALALRVPSRGELAWIRKRLPARAR